MVFYLSATEEAVETSSDSKLDLVEVGFLSGVHGLQGEICIKPNTDFPDLRFSKVKLFTTEEKKTKFELLFHPHSL